ncbi:MAG: gliding motility-associated C-terminal domain-containing protein [Bacteroidia bacterium]|nr:gliding motility-associated C-terminal domain-containing protein [Bacteroidia bacterium]MDW8345619.1 gliding motility-associated C-terminal domain-containing protein [Bacteroidia bacterium]
MFKSLANGFIPNQGQWDYSGKSLLRLSQGNLWIHENFLYYHLWNNADLYNIRHHKEGILHQTAIKMQWVNAQKSTISHIKPNEGIYSYFYENDPKKWITGVKSYQEVWLKNLYPNIHVRLYVHQNHLKYDYVILPHANPSIIEWRYIGQKKTEIKENRIHVLNQVADFYENIPLAYQKKNGASKSIACAFQEKEENFCFSLGDYNPNDTLIIDPQIIFSTYTGSYADNWGFTATYDTSGNAYTAGTVYAFGYPTTPGAFQVMYGGVSGSNSSDCGIMKLSPDGKLIYATYLGAGGNEQPHSLITDKQGNLYIMGTTSSSAFPTTAGSYDRTYNGGAWDIFVAKLNPTGTALVASTFVGGGGSDGINPENVSSIHYLYGDEARGEIMLDKDNNVYVASCTRSITFPVTPGVVKPSLTGLQDACVFKLNTNLSSLLYSTYLGGNGDDAAYGISVDDLGQVYICGGTSSSNYPTLSNSYQFLKPGDSDGFVTKLSADAKNILASTYIGTNRYDQAYLIQLDAQKNVYLVGQTLGNFPVSNGVYNNPRGTQFIIKLDSSLTKNLLSTRFGSGRSSVDLSISAFLVDECEYIYVSGWGGLRNINNVVSGNVAGMPITNNAFQKNTDGSDFYFMVLSKDMKNLLYATYFGGSRSEEHVDGGTSRYDKKGIIYQAICAGCGGNSDLYTTPGVQSSFNNSSNCNNAVLKLDFKSNNIEPKAIFSFSPIQGCTPLNVKFENKSPQNLNYLWIFGDGGTSTAYSPTHTYTQAGTFTVQLIVSNPMNCKSTPDTAFATIEVGSIENPTQKQDTCVCAKSPVILNANNPGASYVWSTGATTQTITVQEPGQYSVTVRNQVGCEKVFYFNVGNYVCQTPKIPNIITPSQDNLNDRVCFKIEGIYDYSLSIYNRWGVVVFESNNPEECWTGETQKTKMSLPEGVYYYIVNAKTCQGDKYRLVGNITIVR